MCTLYSILCVRVKINKHSLELFFVFGSCFRTLAGILFQICFLIFAIEMLCGIAVVHCTRTGMETARGPVCTEMMCGGCALFMYRVGQRPEDQSVQK